jgi:putative toxin-antitoxin system antitoxin component (TIGR02293 family)
MVLTEEARKRFAGFAVADPQVKQAAMVRKGISYAEVKRFTSRTGLNVKRLAHAAGIPKSTLASKKGARLTPVQSEKVVRLERIFAIAFDVFRDDDVAKDWLETANPYLDGHAPLDLLDNEPGAKAVEELLAQIDEGVF